MPIEGGAVIKPNMAAVDQTTNKKAAEEENDNPPVVKKSNNNMLILAAIAVIAVLTGMFLGGGLKLPIPKSSPGVPAKEKSVLYFKISEVTLNLKDDRFLQIDLTLAVEESAVLDELKKRFPEVKDRTIALLQSKSGAEITKPEKRDQLKEELKNAINLVLSKGSVKEVLITGMLVQ